MISILNVLDRCTHPISMLNYVHKMIKRDNSYLLIGLVFPLKQQVAEGIYPDEYIGIDSKDSINKQVNDFMAFLNKLGFQII